MLAAVFYSYCDEFVVYKMLRSFHYKQSALVRHTNHVYFRSASHEQLFKPADLHALQQGIPFRFQPDAVQEQRNLTERCYG